MTSVRFTTPAYRAERGEFAVQWAEDGNGIPTGLTFVLKPTDADLPAESSPIAMELVRRHIEKIGAAE